MSVLEKIDRALGERIVEVLKGLPKPKNSRTGALPAALALAALGARRKAEEVKTKTEVLDDDESDDESDGEGGHSEAQTPKIVVTAEIPDGTEEDGNGKLIPGMGPEKTKDKSGVVEKTEGKTGSTSSQTGFTPKVAGAGVAAGAGGLNTTAKPLTNEEILKQLENDGPRTEELSSEAKKQLEAWEKADTEKSLAEIEAKQKIDLAEEEVKKKREIVEGKITPKLTQAKENAENKIESAQKTADQKRGPNFDALEDKIAKERAEDEALPYDQQRGSLNNLEKARGLRFDSKLAPTAAGAGALNTEANRLDRNFINLNSGPRARALKAANQASDTLGNRYNQIGTLQKKNAKSEEIASRARNLDSTKLSSQKIAGVGAATLGATEKRKEQIKLLQKKNEKTKKIADAANKYLDKTAPKPKSQLANQVENQFVKKAVANLVRLAAPLIAWVLGIVFLLTIIFSTIIYIYCFKVEPIRSTLELAQAPVSFVTDPANAVKDIATLQIPRSAVRKLLEEAGICKSINPNYCSETGKLEGDGSVDNGVGAENVKCLGAPRSGIMADARIRALARTLKVFENGDSYQTTNPNSLSCFGAYQFCPFGAWEEAKNYISRNPSLFPGVSLGSSPQGATPAQQDYAFAAYLLATNSDARTVLENSDNNPSLLGSNMDRWCQQWTPFGKTSTGGCTTNRSEGRQEEIIPLYYKILAEEKTGKCGSATKTDTPTTTTPIALNPLKLFGPLDVQAQGSTDGRNLVVDGIPAGITYRDTGSLAGVPPDSSGGGIDFTVSLDGDYNTSKGAPILSHLAGEVTYVVNDQNGATSGFGNEVGVYYPSIGYTAIYSHMDSVSVKVGDSVSPGSLLGGQGSTGSTRPVGFNHISLNLIKGKVNGQVGASTDIQGVYDPFLKNMMTYYASNLAKIKAKDYSPTAPGSGSSADEFCNPCPATSSSTPDTSLDQFKDDPFLDLGRITRLGSIDVQAQPSSNFINGTQVQTANGNRIAGQPNSVRGGILRHNDKGDDLKASDGYNIYSPVSGSVVTVVNSYPSNINGIETADFGNVVGILVDSGPFAGQTYWLGHNDKQTNPLTIGQKISVGQRIGSAEFGSGSGTGPHYSDLIGKPGDRDMIDANSNLALSAKLAGVKIAGDGKTATATFTDGTTSTGQNNGGSTNCVSSSSATTNSGTLSEPKDPGTDFKNLSEGHKKFLESIAKAKGYSGPFADNGGPDSAAKTAMDRLIAKAKAAGINLQIAGDAGNYGYRGYNVQTSIFLEKIPTNLQYQDSMGTPDKVPQAVKDAYLARAALSAPPGYSEHHTGKAVDFVSDNPASLNLNPATYPADVATWLEKNAPSEGFKLSYPKGSTQGAGYEPWHWIYSK